MLGLIVQCFEILISCLYDLSMFLGLIFDGAIVLLSGGVPYWYYSLVHPKHDDMELGNIVHPQNANNTDLNLGEHWSNNVQQLYDVWKTHQLVVGVVLAPMFTLISISPLPKCSWAYIFAILCLLYGSITFAVCAIHRLYFRNIDESRLYCYSPAASSGGFFTRDTLRFYVSLSLPTVWFTGFLGSFALTILMIMVGEQDPSYEKSRAPSSSTACQNNRLRFLQVVVPLMLAIAATSYVRMRWALMNSTENA